jgi:hypothetical protein
MILSIKSIVNRLRKIKEKYMPVEGTWLWFCLKKAGNKFGKTG